MFNTTYDGIPNTSCGSSTSRPTAHALPKTTAKIPASDIKIAKERAWFDNPANVDMTALYLERTMNYGLTLDELQSGRPIMGIAQTPSA